MKKIVTVIILIFIISSCKKDKTHTSVSTLKIILQPTKIIVVNNGENATVYLNVKIRNPNKKNLILLDNSYVYNFMNQIKPTKTGFYLKNIKNFNKFRY